MIFGFKIGLTRLGLIFASALAIFGEEGIPSFDGKGTVSTVQEFWKGYDARKEPLKIQLVESWKTEQGEVRLVLYSLGRLHFSFLTLKPKNWNDGMFLLNSCLEFTTMVE